MTASASISGPAVTGPTWSSARVRWLFLMLCAYIVIAPLSQAGGSSVAIKLLRVGMTVAMSAMAFEALRQAPRFALTRQWLLLWLFFTVAALWSNSPLNGLIYKGFSMAALLAGLCAGFAIRDTGDFRLGMRYLCLVSAVAAGMAYQSVALAPDLSTRLDRLNVAEINANAIGAAGSPLIIIALYVFMTQRELKWRLIAGATTAGLLWMVLGSGSRGAMGATALGVMTLLAMARIGRATTVLMVGATIPVAGWLLRAASDEELLGVSRVVDRGFLNTRDAVWEHVWERVLAPNPIFGAGWWSKRGDSWDNAMNFVLQIAAETGLVGTLMLLVALLSLLAVVLRVNRLAARVPQASLVIATVSALVVVILSSGMFGSNLVLGTSSHTLLWGFCIAVLTRMEVTLRELTRPSPR